MAEIILGLGHNNKVDEIPSEDPEKPPTLIFERKKRPQKPVGGKPRGGKPYQGKKTAKVGRAQNQISNKLEKERARSVVTICGLGKFEKSDKK